MSLMKALRGAAYGSRLTTNDDGATHQLYAPRGYSWHSHNGTYWYWREVEKEIVKIIPKIVQWGKIEINDLEA